MTPSRFATAAALVLALGGCGVFKGGPKRTPTVGERVPILVSENGAEVDKTLAGLAVTLPAGEAALEWPQPGGSADKVPGVAALAAQPARAWVATIDGGSDRERLAAPPVVAGGRLYAVDVAGTVHSFDAATGAVVWATPLADGKENRGSRFGGGASVDGASGNGGRVYATDGLGDVVALNVADGAIVWRAKPGGPLRGSPTVADGLVYVLAQDNQVFALNQDDGKVQWTATGTLETQGVFGVAAPAASQGTVVAGFSSGELNAYRYENGRVLWQDALSRTSISTSVSSLADIDASPVIEGGFVYAVGQGGRMVALELSTGRRVWEQNIAGISTPAVSGDWLFVVTDDARLICLRRTDGRVRWVSQLRRFRKAKSRSGEITWFGPVLAGGRLVMTNSRGEIVYASPADGAVQATVAAGKSFALPPVVANSTLYALDQAGRISAWR